ncbi:MAG: glycosyltransferase family 2 protein [Candidatus Dormibacteria bacterium]
MELSIIFVNWNSVEYLRESLASIFEHTHGIQFEIIVVDNASPDGNVDALKRQFTDITVLKSSENLGFAGANNLGFKHSSGKHILFLNPDTKVVNPAINIMLETLRSLPDGGIVGCKLLNDDLTVQTSCIQKFPTILNQIVEIEYLRLRWPNCLLWEIGPLFSISPVPSMVEVISGACMMIKREVFERVGLFSEDYFMYAEDVELCYRVQQFGWRCYFVGEARVIHHGGGSSAHKGVNQWAPITQRQAILRFCQKTRGPIYALLFRIATGFGAASRLGLILVLLPLHRASDGRNLRSAFRKWSAIFKWAFGFRRPMPLMSVKQ